MHVLKNTELEKWYNDGTFQPIEREDYKNKVLLFLSHLHPRIAVHRLAAFASRWEELIAPRWTSDRMGTHQYIVDQLRAEQVFQGCLVQPQTESDKYLFEKMKDRIVRIERN